MTRFAAAKYNFVVPMLAGFYPALFFIANNFDIFSFWQIVVLLTLAPVISGAVCFLLTHILVGMIRVSLRVVGFHDPARLSESTDMLFKLITANISLAICFYLLRNTLLSFGSGVGPLLTSLLVVATIVSFVTYKNGLKPLFGMLLTLAAISAIQLSVSTVNSQQQLADSFVPDDAKQLYEKLRFRKKPNVYLVIAESYPNEAALRAVYGVDNSPFYERMKSLGFGIDHNFYSNYNHTLASLPSLFSMEHHYGLISLGNLDSTGGRRILELSAYNPVVSVFQNNGYRINYLHSRVGLVPHGAKADYLFPSPSLFQALAIFLTHQKLMEPTIFSRRQDLSIDALYETLEGVVSNKSPSFNFIYYHRPNHSPSRIKSRSKSRVNKLLSEFRNSYAETIETANDDFIFLFESIIEMDENPLIIVIGDHGSWGYRFGEDSNGRRISYPLYILDRFGVLAGIYARPGELSERLKGGAIKSHVNLFKYVFAYLCEDDRVLETLRPDDSFDDQLIISIRDNHILNKPEKVTLKTVAK